MNAKIGIGLLLVIVVLVGGCARGIHQVPVSRDYRNLEKTKVSEAEAAVAKAHRVGAHHYAKYEFTSAKAYLNKAKEEKAEHDWRATKDFSTLSRNMANEAVQKGSGIPDPGVKARPKDHAACQAEWDRIKAKFDALNRCKAILVSPDLYAHAEASLSGAEEELRERCHWTQAWPYLPIAEADIDTILSQDVDGDGIKDLVDGDPWIPEDKDGYEDEDGIPEPQPYPALSNVHFATASAKLSPEAKGYLKGIAEMFGWNWYGEAKLKLSGHTDAHAGEPYNEDLSLRRVEAVKGYLVDKGIAAGRLESTHFGETKPVADNNTEQGRAQNRRVELMLESPKVKTKYCQ